MRSATVMLGYLGDPEHTAEVLRDGWLHTGDMGYRDADGYLYLVDRKKEVVVTGIGSDNVYTRVLEDFLQTLPGVHNAAAVGVPDERYGEVVRICLAPVKGAVLDTGAVADAVAAELGELYTPKETLVLPELPLTQIGKVDKRSLRARVTASPQRSERCGAASPAPLVRSSRTAGVARKNRCGRPGRHGPPREGLTSCPSRVRG